MNMQPHLFVALLTLSFAGPAWAAAIVDITVTGRLTPDACHVELSEEGVVDHGKIPAHTLSSDEFTVLPSRFLELSVRCARPMLFALVGVDNRSESRLRLTCTDWAETSTPRQSAWAAWHCPI